MKGNTIVLTPEELAQLIDERLRLQLENLVQPKKEDDELMTREEAFTFLSIDSSTLWAWTNKGKVKSYAIGARRYYKKSELIESLKRVE